MLDVLIASFLVGAVGALVIVWFRWTKVLPRFSSGIELEVIETEYEELRGYIANKIKNKKVGILGSPDVVHSNNLRDDIWRQRRSSFFVSAIMYLILGGATAVLFIGLEINTLTDLLDAQVIIKLLTTGALWSSFYSFIDVKKADEIAEKEREKKDKENEEKIRDLTKDSQDRLKEKDKEIKGAKEKIKEATEKANEKIKEANEQIESLVKKYNELVDEYTRVKKGFS